jgi:hypothetical protein
MTFDPFIQFNARPIGRETTILTNRFSYNNAQRIRYRASYPISVRCIYYVQICMHLCMQSRPGSNGLEFY